MVTSIAAVVAPRRGKIIKVSVFERGEKSAHKSQLNRIWKRKRKEFN